MGVPSRAEASVGRSWGAARQAVVDFKALVHLVNQIHAFFLGRPKDIARRRPVLCGVCVKVLRFSQGFLGLLGSLLERIRVCIGFDMLQMPANSTIHPRDVPRLIQIPCVSFLGVYAGF